MLADLRLRHRILLGYLPPLLLLLGSMVFVLFNIQEASRAASQLESYRAQEDGAHEIAMGVLGMQRAMRGYFLLRNTGTIRSYEESEKRFHNQEHLIRQVQDPEQREVLRRLLELGAEVNSQTRQLIELIDGGKEAEALSRFRNAEDFRRTREQAGQLVANFLQGAKELRQQQQEKFNAAIDAVNRSIWLGSVGSILLALLIGWWLANVLSRRISGYAVQLASASSQIAATVTEHERTASQQAAAANETSATIEELAASSRQSAEQAASAAALADEATRSTGEGSAATRETIEAMAGLNDKIGLLSDHIVRLNEQIGQIGIIAVLVRDLAGEINMLALNAAVEASRAGEHGKGFAVVAREVRKLADQSKKSAEQTTALITDIQKATNSSIMMTEDSARMVADATRQAGQMGSLFEQIADVVANVNMNAQQVMLNARQQVEAFNQVVEAVGSISAGTRETAAGIGQTKSTVEQLNLAAQNLKAMA